METYAEYLARTQKEQQQKTAGAASIVLGAQTESGITPDQAAADMKLAQDYAKTTGGAPPPLDMVAQDRSTFQREIEQRRNAKVLGGNPMLSDWLRDPKNAAIASDSVEELSWWEGVGRGGGAIPGQPSSPEAQDAARLQGGGLFGNVVAGVEAAGRGAARGTVRAGAGAAYFATRGPIQAYNDVGKTKDEIYQSILTELGIDDSINTDPALRNSAMQAAMIRYDAISGMEVGDRQQKEMAGAAATALKLGDDLMKYAESIPLSDAGKRASVRIDSYRATLMPDRWKQYQREMFAWNGEGEKPAQPAPVTEQEKIALAFEALTRVWQDSPSDFLAFAGDTLSEAVPGIVAGAATTYATGNPLAGAGVMGVSSASSSYAAQARQFLQEQGIEVNTIDDALSVVKDPAIIDEMNRRGGAYGLIVGLFDAVSGGIAGRAFTKNPFVDVLAQMLSQSTLGAGGEALGSKAATGEVEWLDVLLEGLLEVPTTFPEMVGVGGRGWLDKQGEKARNAKAAQERLQGFVDAATQSVVRERAPEAFRDFIARTTAGKDAETMYVPADKFEEYFQSKGMAVDDVVSQLDGVNPDQVAEALATGGDIAIPTATFAAKIAGSEHDKFLLQNSRFSPEDMTFNEAEEWDKTKAGLLTEAMGQAEELRARAAVEIEAGQQIYDTMTQRITEAGWTADKAKKEASAYRAFYETRAARSGQSVATLLERYPLPVIRGAAQQPAVAAAPQDTAPPAPAELPDLPGFPDTGLALDATEVGESGLKLMHGTTSDTLTPDSIEIVRTGQKQGKKGRSYGGFYATSVADADQAEGYATMGGAQGKVLDVIVKPGTKVLRKDGDVTRLSEADINKWVSEGYGLVVGKDPRGRTEYVVIDKDALYSVGGVKASPAQQAAQEAAPQADSTEGGLYDQTGRAAVDSEPFKQWFGKSAAVDEAGAPMVVYHGTGGKTGITSFDPSKVGERDAGFYGDGFYFTPDEDDADAYAADEDGNYGEIMQVYLSLQNPFIWDASTDEAKAATSEKLAALGIKRGVDAVTANDTDALANADERRRFNEAVRAAGYDGVIVKNEYRLREIVAFDPTQIKSVNNRGTFDRKDPNILNQNGVPLFDRPLTIDGKVTVRAIGEAMTADHLAKHERQYFPENSEEDYQAVLGWMGEEITAQLGHPNSGVGWYGKDVQLSIELAARVYPTLLTNPTHRDLFLTFAGLFSNGAEPEGAFMMSSEAFEHFLATGEIPVSRADASRARGETPRQTSFKDRKTGADVSKDAGWGKRNPANEQQLAFVKHIIEREGSVEAGINWLRSPQPRTEINRAMTSSGLYKAGRYTTKAEIAGPDALGIMAFGEKLGRYTMGLHGVDIDAGDTTIDLWYSRTYRRLTGRLLETPIGDEGVVSGPTDQDRKVIFRLTGDLVKQFDLPAGDVQAVLWFWEKRLWGAQGLRTNEGTNSSGARKLLRSKGLDDGTGSDGQGDGAGSEAAGREYAQAGRGDGGAGYASGGLAPLAGAPTVEGASGPDPRLVAVAEGYARSIGLTLQRQAEFVEVDPERAARIAAAYDAMPHAPNDPRVKEAFENLIEQTKAQYQALVDGGYEFYFIDPENDPYGGNPWNAMRDLRANQRMAVFPTEAGFGSNDAVDVSGNPMEVDTGLEWSFGTADGPKKRVLANDLFRAVHDAFGHGLEGAGFRARGEENAWQAHVRLFQGSAVAAITTETRGQNSWLNYGPNGEANRNAKVEDTVFADQKTGLLPEWAWLEGRAGDEQPVLDERGFRYIESRPQLPIGADGKVELTHWSDEKRDVIDPQKGGTGPLVGPDRRAQRKWSFFGIDARTSRSQPGIGYVKEMGLGDWRHTVKVDPARLYPWYEDPDGIKDRLPRTERYNVDSYARAIKAAGYLGHYVTDDGGGSAVLGVAAAVYEPLPVERAVDDAADQGEPQGRMYAQTLFTPPTPEDLTATDAFKEWFGKSQVADEIGRPKVVFHGSEKAGFVVFDTDGKGKTKGTGAFFTSNFENARTYSGTYREPEFPRREDVLADPEKYGFEVFEYGDGTVYIRDPDGNDVEAEGAEDKHDTDKIAAFMEPMIDDWLTSGSFGEDRGNYSVFLKIENPLIIDAEGASWNNVGASPRFEVLNEDGDFVGYARDEEDAEEQFGEGVTLGDRNGEDVDGQTTDEIVREAKEYGDYDGVIFKNIADEGPHGRGYGIESDVYVVFEPNQIKAVQNRGTFSAKSNSILEQTNRGSIMFPAKGIASGQTVINTFKDADLSTVLHESGHFFLTLMQAEAARGEASAIAEMDAMKAWWLSNAGDVAKDASRSTGVAVSAEDVSRAISFGSSGDFQIDNAIDVGMQEQFARGFEAYLMKGEAPSAELRSIFASFREWLKSIYQSLPSLNVKVSPEMKAVFDRMLATDEQIAKASQREADRAALFSDANTMGLSPEDFAKYQTLATQAQDEAKAKLTAEVMAPIRRAAEKWYRDERAKLVEKLTAEKRAMPIYRAIQEMRFGKTFEGDETPGIKLNRKVIEKHYGGEQMIALLPGSTKRGSGHRYAVFATGDGGMHPDVVAGMYGFGTGSELIGALVNTPAIEQAVETEADALMEQRHGDVLKDGRIEQQAMDAIKNDKKARLIAMELGALNAKIDADKGLKRSALFPKVTHFREMARRTIDRLPLRDARAANRYVSAAKKAADEAFKALAKGDFRAAAEAKRRHLLAHMMYMEARKIDTEVDKLVTRLGKLNRPDSKQAKGVNIDNIKAARAIAGKFGLATPDSAFDFDMWVEQLQQDDPTTAASLGHAIQTYTQNAKPFAALTVGEFRAVADAVANLISLGKSARLIEVEGQQMSKDEAIADLMAVLAKRGLSSNPALRKKLTGAQRMGRASLSMLSALRRVENWARDMDDGEQGPFTRYLVRPVMDALGAYRDERAARLDALLKIINPIRKDVLTGGAISAPELGYTFESKAELLHAILHTGNESNLEKLLMGRGWSAGLTGQQQKTTATGRPSVDRQGNPIMDRGRVDTTRWDTFVARMIAEGKLTKQDYDIAQSIWDLMDELKRPAQSAHRKMFGFYFNEVEASPVVTPFGTYRGGYVPAVADQDASNDGQIRADQNAMEMQQSGFMFPTTGNGFTKSRVQNYRTALSLDLMLLPAHMDKVLRFTHLEPVVRQTAGILTARDMREGLDAYDQTLIPSMLTPWLQRTAQQAVEARATTPAGRAFSNIARELRRRVGIHTMFMNVVNTAQQITGFSTAMVLVKPYRLSAALGRYTAGGAISMRAEAMAQSAFMRERVGGSSRETQRLIQDAVVKPTIPSEMRALIDKHGYALQQITQNVMDVIIWHGAYDQAISKGADDADAVFEADSVVRRTIGDFAPENLSLFETGNAFTRLFTMFYSYFNGQANLVGGEMQTAMRTMGWNGAPRMFWIYLFGIAAPAIVAELIVRGFRGDLEDEDDDGYEDEIAALTLGAQGRYITAMVPIAGQITMALINRFNDQVYDDRLSTSPVVSTVERAAGAPASIGSALFGEGDPKRAVLDGMTALGLITGIPMGQLTKMAGYGIDVSSGKAQPEGPADVVQGITSGKDGTAQ